MNFQKPTMSPRVAHLIAFGLAASAQHLPGIPGTEPEVDRVPPRPCLNKCGKPRTQGKDYCSAECCSAHRAQMKAERKSKGIK